MAAPPDREDVGADPQPKWMGYLAAALVVLVILVWLFT